MAYTFRHPKCRVCGDWMLFSIEKRYLPIEILFYLAEKSLPESAVTQWECINEKHPFRWSIVAPGTKTVWVD
jgi:hypothetical protein